MLRLIRCWSRAISSIAFLPALRVGLACWVSLLPFSPSDSLPGPSSACCRMILMCSCCALSSCCLAKRAARIRHTRSSRSAPHDGRGDWSDPELACDERQDCLTGVAFGVTKRPGDDCRDRMLGEDDAGEGGVWLRRDCGARAFVRTGISSSSSVLATAIPIASSCEIRDFVSFLVAANLCFIRVYAFSPSLCSSSEADAVFSASVSLSEPGEGLRRAASSLGRGGTDVTTAHTDGDKGVA